MMRDVEIVPGRMQFTCFLSNKTCQNFLSASIIALIKSVPLILNNFTHNKLTATSVTKVVKCSCKL
jgi:hypothetical protein